MKKFISIALLLALCLALFAGCTPEEPAAPAENPLVNAKNYLFAMYRNTEGVVRRDFERVSVVMIDGVKYSVTWTSDDTENVVITAGETTTAIDINEKPVEEVQFKLTATITDANGKTESVTFSHSIEAVAPSAYEIVTTPKAGATYKFVMEQNQVGKVLYFTGEMSGYYLATTEDPAAAVNVKLEETTGGFHITFTKDGAKKYIDVIPRPDNAAKTNVVIADAPTCVYTWDAERKTMTTVVNGTTWYLGTYGTNVTFGPSTISYIEDVSKIGVSQFPAGFAAPSTSSSTIKNGAKVVLYFAKESKYITATDYLYTSSSGSTKHELALSENQAEGIVLTLKISGDQVTFVTADNKYLMCDGTNVQFVDAEGEFTKFALEEAAGGYFIKSSAEYNGKAQYLEVYSGYMTCYGMNDTKADIYTFELKAA